MDRRLPTAGNKRKRDYFLPQDLVADILPRLLPRLSTAAAVRFRCVCKSWDRLLSDGKFIYRHLLFSDNGDNNNDYDGEVMITKTLDKWACGSDIYYSLLSHDKLLPKKTPYENRKGLCYKRVPSTDYSSRYNFVWSSLEIVGCCNGLFCIAHRLPKTPTSLILWNPSNSETLTLPDAMSNLGLNSECYGFGFDSRTKDYEVVRILFNRLGYTTTEVYSLMNKSWRIVNANAKAKAKANFDARGLYFAGTTSGGKFYWYKALYNYIACLDIREDRFSHQIFPTSLTEEVVPELGELHLATTSKEDSLVALFQREKDKFEIWGLLRYQSMESWTKLFHCDIGGRIPGLIHTSRVIGASGNRGEYILLRLTDNGELLRFNFEEEKVSAYNGKVSEHGLLRECFIYKAYCYVPSQVSIRAEPLIKFYPYPRAKLPWGWKTAPRP
ncbi:F-box/kelch-repeat protein At3g23880 [Linum grandiflorum]